MGAPPLCTWPNLVNLTSNPVFSPIACKRNSNAKEVTERFTKWKPVGDMKFLFPIHTMIGANKVFAIIESDSVELVYKNTAPWTDLCVFEFYPIIDTRESMALLQR